MVAQSTNAAPELLALGHQLSRGSSLDPVEREVVILRVARLCNAAYQAHEHHAVALRHGFSEEKIAAVAEYPAGTSAEEFTDFEQTLIDFTDAVVETTTVPDALFAKVADRYDHSRLVELVLMIGFYMMVGRVMNTFEIELERDRSAVPPSRGRPGSRGHTLSLVSDGGPGRGPEHRRAHPAEAGGGGKLTERHAQ